MSSDIHGSSPLLTLAELAQALQRARHVYVSGGATEPASILKALAQSHMLDGLVLSTAVVPGIIGSAFAEVDPVCSIEMPLLSEAVRRSTAAFEVLHLPLHYSDYYAYLRESPVAAALVGTTRPSNGYVSLSLTQDFAPALLERPVALYAAMNANLPWVRNGIEIPLSRFAGVIDAESPLPTYPSRASSVIYEQIGLNTSRLVDNGDTIQTGIGSAPAAVLAALTGHRDLAIHAGLITRDALSLLNVGALGRGITTNVAVGDDAFYRDVASSQAIRFRPVGETHDVAKLAKIPNFIAINGAIEVDLFGQVSAEMIGGRQVTGHGGIADFCRGAKSSSGGKSIVVLPSTTSDGRTSRIVASLPSGTVVSASRADVDYVVTEFGVAALRHRNVTARSEALISVAAPNFRGKLCEDWDRRRKMS